MDVGHRCAGVGIDPDATVVDRNTGSVQPQIRKPGATASGHQHTPTIQGLIIPQPRRQRPGISLHGHQRLLQQHLDALLTHAIQHGICQLGIKATQQPRPTHHLGDRNTKAPQDAGELAGNKACAHHHHRGRDIFQQKNVVTDPGVFNPWNLRPGRTATHCHKEPRG